MLHFTGRRCELHRNFCKLVSDLAGNCCRVAVALNREDLIIVRVPLVGALGVIRHRRCHKRQGLELCHFSLAGFAVLGFQLNASGRNGSVYSDLPGVFVLPTNITFVGVLNGNQLVAYLVGPNRCFIAILDCKAYSIGVTLPLMIVVPVAVTTAG